jgi:hypothetical protein
MVQKWLLNRTSDTHVPARLIFWSQMTPRYDSNDRFLFGQFETVNGKQS